MMKIFSIIGLLFLIASCNSNNEIFRAVKIDNYKTEISIFENKQYIIKVNNSITEKGNIHLKENRLTLVPKPDNHLIITLIHSKEYKILGNNLCEFHYQSQERDSSQANLLLTPIKELKEDCFKIVVAFKD